MCVDASRRTACRPGFSLPEMLVAMVLFAIVGAAMVGAVVQQQRFVGDAGAVVGVRTSVRQLTEIIPTELRSASPAGGDIYAMTDTSVTFRGTFGGAVVCSVGAVRTTLVIPPRPTEPTAAFSWWVQMPGAGDSVLVYDAGNTLTSQDDRWRAYGLTAAPSAGLCPMTTGYTRSAGEATGAWTLTLSGALPQSVAPGALIRFFRPVEYGLFRASDGRWYAGYRDCVATRAPACGSYEIVAGPLRAPGGAAAGIELQYFDSTGAAVVTPAGLSLIRLAVRAETQRALRADGFARAVFGDSLITTIALRNRR
ncbi:MAG: PulJ/GspJ family protein [Gemmatimonadaceae bacterium]